jgi:uncharacterized membrane protein YqjE
MKVSPAPDARSSRTGLFESLRRLSLSALELASVRLELLVTDLEIEKRRLVDVLLRILLGVLLLGLGLILFVGFVLLLLWEQHRLAALGVLTVGSLAGGVWLLMAARRQLRDGAPVFAATRAELRRDRSALGPPLSDEHAQL